MLWWRDCSQLRESIKCRVILVVWAVCDGCTGDDGSSSDSSGSDDDDPDDFISGMGTGGDRAEEGGGGGGEVHDRVLPARTSGDCEELVYLWSSCCRWTSVAVRLLLVLGSGALVAGHHCRRAASTSCIRYE